MSPEEQTLHAALMRVMTDLRVGPQEDIKALAFHIGRIAAQCEATEGQGLKALEESLMDMVRLAYKIEKAATIVKRLSDV